MAHICQIGSLFQVLMFVHSQISKCFDVDKSTESKSSFLFFLFRSKTKINRVYQKDESSIIVGVTCISRHVICYQNIQTFINKKISVFYLIYLPMIDILSNVVRNW